ncbi:SDR family NAD(P)-dependent oxidoreductase [Propioniciclava sp.]|uniref:SDR family NAD(P)-dependent oxidoreductase n=1 Tax=Propioniciclava sp. TaxID=2038686 RepID=UPI00261FDA2D|nr:SDR family NAD(P)-dependent oxidoreductase [Propioniciclava sp.]
MSDTPKTAVITGASDGIGAAAALALAGRGWQVAVVGRQSGKVHRVADAAGAAARPFVADFAVLADVRRLAGELSDAYPHVDILANNAGALLGERTETVDGHETSFQVNHLAPFLLTNLLRDRLVAAHGGVVNTSSVAHRNGRLDLGDPGLRTAWTRWSSYGLAKQANILFAAEINRRWGGDGVRGVSFHPGGVATGFAGDLATLTGRFYRSAFGKRVMRTPAQGADTLVWLSQLGPDAWVPGAYYVDRKPAKVASRSADAELARRLWDVSAEWVGL